MIDSHCHPQFPQYDKDRKEMIKRVLDEGVQMICVGTDLEMSKKAIELAAKHDGVWATVGLHPNDVNQEVRIMNYEELLGEPRVIAVGEVGLDYYRTLEPEKQKKQSEIFKQFIELAQKFEKPLVIHCRNAHDDMITILKTVNWKLKTGSGVIHSFTGTWPQAQQYLDLGFAVGLNGIITFTDQYDETVINTPLGRILLETDAPYLTPEPYRGKRNEPLYVIEVAKKIAELKNLPVKKIAEQTTKNTTRLFGLL